MFKLGYYNNKPNLIIILTLKYEKLSISLSPTDANIIKNVDIEANTGHIDNRPKNGEFSIDWNEKRIDICCACSYGGNLFVSIPYTQETMTSLKVALRKWKKILE